MRWSGLRRKCLRYRCADLRRVALRCGVSRCVRWLRRRKRRLQRGWVDGGEPKGAATSPVEARCPDKSRTAGDAIDRQSFLSRTREVADEIDEQPFSRAASLRQRLEAVLVQRLQLDLPPYGHCGTGGPGSIWHSCYSRRSAKPARVALDFPFDFTCVEKCRLLIAVCVNNGSVLRVKDRICSLEGAAPLAAPMRLLTPRKSIELLARTTFVFSERRAVEPDSRTKGDSFDRVGRHLSGKRVAGAQLGVSGPHEEKNHRRPR